MLFQVMVGPCMLACLVLVCLLQSYHKRDVGVCKVFNSSDLMLLFYRNHLLPIYMIYIVVGLSSCSITAPIPDLPESTRIFTGFCTDSIPSTYLKQTLLLSLM